jgi:hypothetical protein
LISQHNTFSMQLIKIRLSKIELKAYKIDTHFIHFGTTLFLFFLFSSCRPTYKSYVTQYKQTFPKNESSSTPDYSNLNYWAAHPWKKDPSDSIPQPLLNEPKDSLIDVFFVHPTTLTSKKLRGKTWNADINDAALNAKTDYSSILYQASVFNSSCRVFAPRYRQAHLYSFFTKDKEQGKMALRTAYEDVKNAFEYYLKHYNNGRPIIIAGHSQGTLHAQLLLKNYFDGTTLSKQLVCAYIPGLVIAKKEFVFLQPCADSTTTGCFTGWRTYRRKYIPPYIKDEITGSWVTNPLTWSLNSLPAQKDRNQGAVLYNFNKIIPHPNGAQIHEGILWVERPKFPGSILYFSKNYHPGDINLFYMNIRHNIKQRLDAYFQRPEK